MPQALVVIGSGRVGRNVAWATGSVLVHVGVILARSVEWATVGTDDPVEAVVTASFFAAPTLLVFVIVATRSTQLPLTAGITVLGGWLWWSAAATSSSTASIGPFVYGWLLGPLAVAAGESLLRLLTDGRRRHAGNAAPSEEW